FSEASAAHLPLVAKPKTNVSADGCSLYPQLLLTRDELERFQAASDELEYFFQEFVRGDSVYLLFYIPRSGADAIVWSQRNLLQQPGGKSMICASPATLHETEFAD